MFRFSFGSIKTFWILFCANKVIKYNYGLCFVLIKLLNTIMDSSFMWIWNINGSKLIFKCAIYKCKLLPQLRYIFHTSFCLIGSLKWRRWCPKSAMWIKQPRRLVGWRKTPNWWRRSPHKSNNVYNVKW